MSNGGPLIKEGEVDIRVLCSNASVGPLPRPFRVGGMVSQMCEGGSSVVLERDNAGTRVSCQGCYDKEGNYRAFHCRV